MENQNYEKKGYLLEDFRLFHLADDNHGEFPYHYHAFHKVIVVLAGRTEYAVEGERYALEPGDFVLVGRGSIHRPIMTEGEFYERIVFYISPEYLRRESTEDCSLLQLFSGEKGHVLRTQQRLFRLASQLEQELGEVGYGREILSSSALLRLLVQIGRAMEKNPDPGAGAKLPTSPRIREIMAYIEAHLEEDLDAETIADAFFVTKFHMMRQFRRETGTTVHHYITQKRLIRARELMDGGMRATEACYRSGFRSYSSFTRACAKHFGATPTGRLDTHYVREEAPE